MEILRAPNDRVLVVIPEVQGVTDDDIGAVFAESEAFQSLFQAVKGEAMGVKPCGSPSRMGDGISHATIFLFEAPPVMWFQQNPAYWEWAEDVQLLTWPPEGA